MDKLKDFDTKALLGTYCFLSTQQDDGHDVTEALVEVLEELDTRPIQDVVDLLLELVDEVR